MKPRLILFSGMGGDARLMAPLRLPEFEVITPDHVPPQPGESLPAYAARVAKAHAIQNSDIVGGASFGGMLAAEIAKQQGAAGLILLGSCLNPRLLPHSYRLMVALGGVIPDFFLGFRSWRLRFSDQADRRLGACRSPSRTKPITISEHADHPFGHADRPESLDEGGQMTAVGRPIRPS